ncbi:glycosyltransferase family 39 protein [Candidimonas sp. SYP-B2681]|uniref:glycosyltransferase family 39 protein n=1 Tax=Candidimonas sp. SYP-B2681 TaxID=2497686 RepID=UPI000F87110E|nr:glycosyltransferase family 39 protein [Candidimonas sp. SYP-B2681]RTZ40968.1 glycosyltransferase family 39 protein [Candidimonas sp. SYP-B2681]
MRPIYQTKSASAGEPNDVALSKNETALSLLNLQVLLFLAGMVALWTLLCAISHLAPDLDGMEELVWASSLELGYYKHPPFPSWVMYGLTQLFGRSVWLTFFAGQLCSTLALWFVWLLGREFTTPRKAFIVMLLLSTTIYFSLRGTIFNHNTAQLWSIAAATWLFYRALRYQRLGTWLWLGAVSAIAIMTKYSAVIQFAAFFCFMLRQGSFNDSRNLKGIAGALGTFLLVSSPHAYWLVLNAFQPFRYADTALEAQSHLDALVHLFKFALDQCARLSPMLVVMLILWQTTRKSASAAVPSIGGQDTASYWTSLSGWDRSFLLWVGLAPMVLTVLISAILGTRLQASWATTFFILYAFYALRWMYGNEQVNLRRIAMLVIALHILMAVVYAAARGPLAWHSGRDARSTFPGPAIATEMNAIWRKHIPESPLALVVSDTWLGGNVAVNSGPGVEVFINADYAESPWLDPATSLDCGALVVHSRLTKGEPGRALKNLFNLADWHGVAAIQWSSKKSPVIDLHWAIIPPKRKCADRYRTG